MDRDRSPSPQPGPSSSTSVQGAMGGRAEEEPCTLAELLSLPENLGANLVVPREWCPHLQSAREGANRLAMGEEGARVGPEEKCLDCGAVGENWVRAKMTFFCGVGGLDVFYWCFCPQVCLHCCEVRCSRYVNECSLLHPAIKEGHVLCLSLADLSVWCYGCEDYLGDSDDALFAAKNRMHVAKFGKEMPRRAPDKEAGPTTLVLQ